jgi:hypothetical protein
VKLSVTGLLFLTLIAGLTARAAELSGTLKPKFSITDQPIHDSSLTYTFQVTLRLMVHHRTGNVSFDIAYLLSPTAGNPALSGENDVQVFRLADPETRIFPSSWNGDESVSILQDIDRLNVRLRVSGAALTIGRQAVYWGVAKSVSPTDFIAPFQYGTLDTEYRIGVDALRSVVPIGIMSELDTYDRSWLNAALYGFLEYHFSSPGTNNPDNYPDVLEGNACRSGGIYLLGKHYLSPGANWSVTPLLSFTGQALVNITDGSAYLSVTSEYSISQNTVINAGLSRGLGNIPNDAAGDAGSEFGTWPAHYSLSAGYYF